MTKSDEPDEQPTVIWEKIESSGWTGIRATHPPGQKCVYIDRQCSCGKMEIGIIRP